MKLRVAEAMSGYVLEWLRLGRADLGLLYQFVDDKDLRSIALLTETLVLLGPMEPPPGVTAPPADAPVAFADLAALPPILPSPGHGLRDFICARAAELGVPLRTDIDIDACGAINALVGEGLGYAILPAHALHREIGTRQVRSWVLTPSFARTVHLVLATIRPLSAAARAVEELCRITLRNLRSGVWHGAQMRVSVEGRWPRWAEADARDLQRGWPPLCVHRSQPRGAGSSLARRVPRACPTPSAMRQEKRKTSNLVTLS